MTEEKHYVLFGFNLSNEDETGYFGKNGQITDEISKAKVFSSKKQKRQHGFGTPSQWMKLINADADINNGYRFHLVSVKV